MIKLKKYLILQAALLILINCIIPEKSIFGAEVLLPETSLKKLIVKEREIVTADNEKKPLKLRGVVFTGGVWFYSRENPGAASILNIQFMQSESDIQRIAGWGANLITFYMNYNWFENNTGYQFMDQVLSWCRKANIYIIPSLTVYPVGGLRGGPEFFTSQDARAKLKKFWVEFAGRYRGRPEIAGYDILNEPQGTSAQEIAAYQKQLIDAVRKADPDTIIFIEPTWGNPKDFQIIDRPNLVYNAHYYEPYYFTSQGWPWIFAGGVPIGLDYPDTNGEMVKDIKPVNGEHGSYLPVIEPGTYDWRAYTITQDVPAGAEYMFIKLFSNGDRGATLWFDKVEYSLDGSPYRLFPNGSFEDKNPISSEPLFWEHWQAGKGNLYRTNTAAKEGKYSICIQNASAWAHYGNYSEGEWLATLPAVGVVSGQKVSIRFWVKAQNASAKKNGLNLFFCRAQKEVYTQKEVERDIKFFLIDFSTRYNVPVFVGEFTPSLLGKRPDILRYINDVVGYWNTHNISWTFYLYRDTGLKYMGIYNGPVGVTTKECSVDQELLETLQSLISK